MNTKTQEVWVMIPDANDRFQVSNLGHVQQLGWMRMACGNAIPLLKVEPLPLTCELSTGRLGWRLDDGRFRPRDELMALFDVNTTTVSVDHSKDAELLRGRESANTGKSASLDFGETDYRPDRFVMATAFKDISSDEIAGLLPSDRGIFKTDFTRIIAENFSVTLHFASELLQKALREGKVIATVQPKRCRWHKAGILITRR